MLFFTDTCELKLALLSTFPFSTKVVICKDRHLHIPKPNVEISGICTPNIKSTIECKDRDFLQSKVTRLNKGFQSQRVQDEMLRKIMSI